MIYIAAATLVALTAISFAWAGVVRGMLRQQARERGLLLDQMMHLAGRTWTPPPAAEPPAETDDESLDFGLTGPVFEYD